MRVMVLHGKYTLCSETIDAEDKPHTVIKTLDAAGQRGVIIGLSIFNDGVVKDRIDGAQVQLDGAAETDRFHFPLDALTREPPAAGPTVGGSGLPTVDAVPLTIADLPPEMLPVAVVPKVA